MIETRDTPRRTADRASDIFRATSNPLDAIYRPSSVAVIGATEKAGSVGRTVLWNLISSPFGGTVFPINPGRPSVLGVKAYPSLAEVPDAVDLAVIVTPASTAPGLVAACGAKGVKGVIIISAGFREIGPEGAELERQVLAAARAARIRVVGPNCLGVMNPIGGLNATFAAGMAPAGSVGFISQSGALCTAILDWSRKENVGFSGFVSVGSMLDVSWGDLIGLDVCLDIMKVLYEGFRDSKYRPCPLLERMVEAGRLGRKSGRGFYHYAKA